MIDDIRCFPSIAEALKTGTIDYAVVANETSEHAAAIAELRSSGFHGRLLIEKPLSNMPREVTGDGFACAGVGYNLRFHPVITALADAVAKQRILSMQVYCGQYLPDWRPGRDYRTIYSGSVAAGGGVLRDLSHELDYLLWIGGPWRRVAELGGHISNLEIESDDCFALLVELERCPIATLQVNYVDHPGRREIIVNTVGHTYRADLIAKTLVTDDKVQSFDVERDATYIAEHDAVLAGDFTRLCRLDEGERVVEFVAAGARAAAEGRWVTA